MKVPRNSPGIAFTKERGVMGKWGGDGWVLSVHRVKLGILLPFLPHPSKADQTQLLAGFPIGPLLRKTTAQPSGPCSTQTCLQPVFSGVG